MCWFRKKAVLNATFLGVVPSTFPLVYRYIVFIMRPWWGFKMRKYAAAINQYIYINIISMYQQCFSLQKIIDHPADSSGILGGLPISTNKSCHKIWYLLLLGLPGEWRSSARWWHTAPPTTPSGGSARRISIFVASPESLRWMQDLIFSLASWHHPLSLKFVHFGIQIIEDHRDLYMIVSWILDIENTSMQLCVQGWLCMLLNYTNPVLAKSPHGCATLVCSASQVQEFEPKNMHNATVPQLNTHCYIESVCLCLWCFADQKADKSGPIWEGLHAKGTVTCNSTSHRKSWVFSASPCQNPVVVYLQMSGRFFM